MKIRLDKAQKHLDWLKELLFLDFHNKSARKRVVRRGEVYECHLGKGIGNELEKNRPCVIIQNDIANKKAGTTIIAPITNTPGPKKICVEIIGDYPYHRNKPKKLQGYINLSHMKSVSKARLGDQITNLKEEINELDEKILSSLGLYKKYKRTIDKDKKYIKKVNDKNYMMKQIIKRELGLDEDKKIDIEEIYEKITVEK